LTIATYLFSWVSGTGTQIQHFLGNLFKNPILERLFDEYELFHVLRAGENFDTQKHKHIFVYALLGFVLKHADKKQLYHFIGSEIITPNKHLFPPVGRSLRLRPISSSNLQICVFRQSQI
jgi:hypothetical protein